MRTLFTTIAIATGLAGVALAAAPAAAQRYGYPHHGDHRGWHDSRRDDYRHHRHWQEHRRWDRHHDHRR